jgi:hypothetical protein
VVAQAVSARAVNRAMNTKLFFMTYRLHTLRWGIWGAFYHPFFSFRLGVPTLLPLLHKPDDTG